MLKKGNIVKLNSRGLRHHDKKYYRKSIHKTNYMIVIGPIKIKNNKTKWLLRDAFSDICDNYYDIHLELVADTTQFLYNKYLN